MDRGSVTTNLSVTANAIRVSRRLLRAVYCVHGSIALFESPRAAALLPPAHSRTHVSPGARPMRQDRPAPQGVRRRQLRRSARRGWRCTITSMQPARHRGRRQAGQAYEPNAARILARVSTTERATREPTDSQGGLKAPARPRKWGCGQKARMALAARAAVAADVQAHRGTQHGDDPQTTKRAEDCRGEELRARLAAGARRGDAHALCTASMMKYALTRPSMSRAWPRPSLSARLPVPACGAVAGREVARRRPAKATHRLRRGRELRGLVSIQASAKGQD